MIPVSPANFKGLRRIAGLSQTDVARMEIASCAAISRYEKRGTGISKPKLRRIMRELTQQARRVAKSQCRCPLCGQEREQ